MIIDEPTIFKRSIPIGTRTIPHLKRPPEDDISNCPSSSFARLRIHSPNHLSKDNNEHEDENPSAMDEEDYHVGPTSTVFPFLSASEDSYQTPSSCLSRASTFSSCPPTPPGLPADLPVPSTHLSSNMPSRPPNPSASPVESHATPDAVGSQWLDGAVYQAQSLHHLHYLQRQHNAIHQPVPLSCPIPLRSSVSPVLSAPAAANLIHSHHIPPHLRVNTSNLEAYDIQDTLSRLEELPESATPDPDNAPSHSYSEINEVLRDVHQERYCAVPESPFP